MFQVWLREKQIDKLALSEYCEIVRNRMSFLLSLKFYLLVDSFLLNVGYSDPVYPTVKKPKTKNQSTNSKASQLPPKSKFFLHCLFPSNC